MVFFLFYFCSHVAEVGSHVLPLLLHSCVDGALPCLTPNYLYSVCIQYTHGHLPNFVRYVLVFRQENLPPLCKQLVKRSDLPSQILSRFFYCESCLQLPSYVDDRMSSHVAVYSSLLTTGTAKLQPHVTHS